MSKQRTFIHSVAVLGNILSIGTLSTTGEVKTTEVQHPGGDPRNLLGASIILGTDGTQNFMQVEPGIHAYFPSELLELKGVEAMNLNYIKNSNQVVIGKAKQLPAPFTKAGVQLPTGAVVGLGPNANLEALTEQELLWTLGEDPETQAIAELLPEHWWIEGIQECPEKTVNVFLWNGTHSEKTVSDSVEELRARLNVTQISSDLIGEAFDITTGILPGNRRGVPNPNFVVQTLVLNPSTLWQWAEVLNDTTVEFANRTWKLKTPIDSSAIQHLIVTPSDLEI